MGLKPGLERVQGGCRHHLLRLAARKEYSCTGQDGRECQTRCHGSSVLRGPGSVGRYFVPVSFKVHGALFAYFYFDMQLIIGTGNLLLELELN